MAAPLACGAGDGTALTLMQAAGRRLAVGAILRRRGGPGGGVQGDRGRPLLRWWETLMIVIPTIGAGMALILGDRPVYELARGRRVNYDWEWRGDCGLVEPRWEKENWMELRLPKNLAATPAAVRDLRFPRFFEEKFMDTNWATILRSGQALKVALRGEMRRV